MQEFEATLRPGKSVSKEIIMIPEAIPEPDIADMPLAVDAPAEEFSDIQKLADEALEKVSKAGDTSALDNIER